MNEGDFNYTFTKANRRIYPDRAYWFTVNLVYGFRKELTMIKKSISIGAKGYGEKKVNKSTQGMPWLSEAMKDVISCDKHWGLANMN